MTLRVVWDRMNAEVPNGTNSDGQAVFKNVLLRRGDEIPAEVTDFSRSLYLSIGAAKDDGLATSIVQQASAQENTPAPSPALTPEQPPNPSAPAGGIVVEEGETSPDVTTLPARPENTANKDVWEDYAVSLGFKRTEAESLTKPNLIKAADAKRAELEKAQA